VRKPTNWAGPWLPALLAGVRLLLAVVVGLILAGAPLHHALHRGDEGHSQTCPICVLAGTTLDASPSELSLPAAAICDAVEVPVLDIFLPLNSFDLLPPGRAPPAVLIVS